MKNQNIMEQMRIAYYYDSYERTKEHLIVTKRVGKIPQHGSYIVLGKRRYKIVQAEYDYEVSQMAGILLYDVIISEI